MSSITMLPHWLDDGSRLYTKNAARDVWLSDDRYYTGGNVVATPDWGIGWNTAQTVDALYLGLSAAQNTVVVAEYADRTFDFAHGAQTNPTVYIHSAAQSTTQWGSLAHDQTNFVITAGAGAISLVPSGVGASGVLLTNSAGARTAAHTVVTFDGTAGAAAGGTLFDINVTQTGAGASPLFDIDVSTVYTGEIFSAIIGAVAYTSDVINIDLGNTQTAAQLMVLDAGDSARTTDAIQMTDNTTSTGDTFAITVAGAAASGAVFDIDVGAVLWVGDVLNLDLGATSVGGQLIVLAGGAAARTAHLVELNDAGTSTGIGFDINKTGGSYSTGLGYIDLVRSGNFTGVDTETAMDFRIAPSFTLTEPAGGTFTYYGAAIDMSGVLVTAAAGTTLISALTLTGSADADIGRSRALVLGGTDARNGIQFGTATTAPIIYSYAAEIIRIMNSTDANGIVFEMSTGATQAIRTVSATTGSLVFQNQTMTPGSTHAAVAISPTWAAEDFIHRTVSIIPTQNGANSATLTGGYVLMTKATGATVLAAMRGIHIDSPTVTGTVTTSIGIDIETQSVAGITTARAIRLIGTGAANGIELADGALLYGNSTEVIRMMDSTDARGIVYTLTAAGVQTIGTTAGNLTLSPGSANVATAANVDVDMSAGGRLFGGGVQVNSQTLAANTNLTMDENDGHIVITTGAVSVNTITLPAASGNEGMIVSFYVTTDGGQNANIVRAGADVIQNGSADLANTQVALDDAGDYLMLECVSSTMWQVVVNSGGTVT